MGNREAAVPGHFKPQCCSFPSRRTGMGRFTTTPNSGNSSLRAWRAQSRWQSRHRPGRLQWPPRLHRQDRPNKRRRRGQPKRWLPLPSAQVLPQPPRRLRRGLRRASSALNLVKNSPAIFCAVASTRREPICASFPPTDALALYSSRVDTPCSVSLTRASPLAKPRDAALTVKADHVGLWRNHVDERQFGLELGLDRANPPQSRPWQIRCRWCVSVRHSR